MAIGTLHTKSMKCLYLSWIWYGTWKIVVISSTILYENVPPTNVCYLFRLLFIYWFFVLFFVFLRFKFSDNVLDFCCLFFQIIFKCLKFNQNNEIKQMKTKSHRHTKRKSLEMIEILFGGWNSDGVTVAVAVADDSKFSPAVYWWSGFLFFPFCILVFTI